MNLGALRNYRAKMEEILRAELAGLEAALVEVTDRCRLLQEGADRAADAYVEVLHGGVSRDEAEERMSELTGRAEAIMKAADAVNDMRRRWERKRAEVFEAAREHKKLSLLEKRHVLRKRLRANLLEQHALDEAARTRFLRQQTESISDEA
jgi:flagellar export protein FliJ